LISQGHAEVWSYTPRQIIAYFFLASQRQRRDAATALSVTALGTRGEEREVNKTMREWSEWE